MQLLMGIDLGGTNTRVGLAGEKGLLAEDGFSTLADRGPKDWLARLTPVVKALLVKARDMGGEITAIGLGTPGVLDRLNRSVVTSPNLKLWQGFPFGQSLDRALGLPVILENDANCYALGEHRFGRGRGRNDLACFTLGTGVGGGLVLGGRLVAGPLGCGGELGHIVVEPGGRLCGCGAHGCVEAYASATGFRAELKEALLRGAKTSLASGSGVKDMESAALSGDELARSLFNKAGLMLARAFAATVSVTGVDLIVVGGGVSRGWFLMEEACRRELAKLVCMCPASGIQIVRSQLGDTAPLLGAASLVHHDPCGGIPSEPSTR